MRMQNKMTAQDQSLEALFAEARLHVPQPSDTFMARLMADADAAQPQPVVREKRGLWSKFLGAIGGAVVIAGMGSAAMAGLVIGYVQPDEMLQLSETIGLSTSEQIEVLPSFDIFLNDEATE